MLEKKYFLIIMFAVIVRLKPFSSRARLADRVSKSRYDRAYYLSLQTCPACALRLLWLLQSTCTGSLAVCCEGDL